MLKKIKQYFAKRGGVSAVIRKRVSKIVQTLDEADHVADFIEDAMIFLESALPNVKGSEKARLLIAMLRTLLQRGAEIGPELQAIIDDAHAAFTKLRGGVK